MRTGLSALVLLAALTTAAAARPLPGEGVSQPERPIQLDLSSTDSLVYASRPVHEDTTMLLSGHGQLAPPPTIPPSISIGPFRAELGSGSGHAHLAKYRLEGVEILGGGISGTIDGRAAQLAISWPTGR
jgi:hypothetical protein